VKRRKATGLIVIGGIGAITTGCTAPVEPSPAPSPPRTSLLQKLRQSGYNATSQAYGSAGGRRVLIDDDPNWIFRFNGSVVGIGPDVNPPTLKVDEITVPANASVTFGRS
jgi:hypothetical protein